MQQSSGGESEVRSPRRRWWWTAVPVSAALLLGACGGGSSSATSASTTAPGSTAAGGQATSADLQKYQDCLKQNGIDIPFGGGRRNGQGGDANGAGAAANGATDTTRPPQPTDANGNAVPRTTIDPAVRQKAEAACGPAPQGAGRPAGANGATPTAYNAYLSCLKDNGVTVPDPATLTPGAASGRGAAGGVAPPSSTAPGASTGGPSISMPPGGGDGGPAGGGRGRFGGVDDDGVPRFLLRGVDETSATFIAAHAKCKVLLPDPSTLGANGGPGAAANTPTTTAKG